jgi:hypothetical protein
VSPGGKIVYVKDRANSLPESGFAIIGTGTGRIYKKFPGRLNRKYTSFITSRLSVCQFSLTSDAQLWLRFKLFCLFGLRRTERPGKLSIGDFPPGWLANCSDTRYGAAMSQMPQARIVVDNHSQLRRIRIVRIKYGSCMSASARQRPTATSETVPVVFAARRTELQISFFAIISG